VVIFVKVVFISDIEGRVREDQVHRPGFDPLEPLDAVPVIEAIPLHATFLLRTRFGS
jgi:hypothetical protein